LIEKYISKKTQTKTIREHYVDIEEKHLMQSYVQMRKKVTSRRNKEKNTFQERNR
jgi:hypothetical protein